jgi:hypothetical protein
MTSYARLDPYVFALTVLALACGPDSSESTSDTGGPLPAACECVEGDPCSQPLCDTVDLADRYISDNDINPAFDAALNCALEALRDRKVGRLRWTNDLGESDEYQIYESLGDGTARRTTGGQIDLCRWNTEEVILGTLAAPTVFSACLAEADVEKRFNCLRDAVTEETTVCAEGDYECSF